MKFRCSFLLPAFALAVFALPAPAETETQIRRLDAADDHPHRLPPSPADQVETEKVAFLGIETAPAGRTLGAQLGLVRDTGLVVTRVLEKSPAAGVLDEHDVLIKLDDQRLVNMPQLGALVRSHKDGDEIKLTLVRGGKETMVKVNLSVRERPKLANSFFFQSGPGWGGVDHPGPLPGMEPGDSRKVLRMIEHARGGLPHGHGVQVVRGKDNGATVLDLASSNISYSDDDGSIEIKSENKQRNLTIKDAKGQVTFQGPVNSPAERESLPGEVKKQLEKLNPDTIDFEAGDDFRTEFVPLPAEARAGKVIRISEDMARIGGEEDPVSF